MYSIDNTYIMASYRGKIAFEELNRIIRFVYSGLLKLEESKRFILVSQGNIDYDCLEIVQMFKDINGNLNYTGIHRIDESKNFHEFTLEDHTNY